MTDKDIEKQIKIIKEVSKEFCKSKKKARKFLKDIGITQDLIKTEDITCSICLRELPNKDMKNKKGCDWCVPKGSKKI